MSDGVTETQIGPLANYVESFQEIRIDSANNTAEFGTIGQVTMITKVGHERFPWQPVRLLLDAVVSRPQSVRAVAANGDFPSARRKRRRSRRHSEGLQRPQQDVRVRLVRDVSRQRDDAGVHSHRPADGVAFRRFLGPHHSRARSAHAPAFPGNRIPSNRLNRDCSRHAEPLLSLSRISGTHPAASNQNYRENLSLPAMKQDYYMIRGDHRFSDKDSLMGRYTLQDFKTDSFTGTLPTIARRLRHAQEPRGRPSRIRASSRPQSSTNSVRAWPQTTCRSSRPSTARSSCSEFGYHAVWRPIFPTCPAF